MTETPPRSLWRIPVLWLVIALPLASIVAGVGLVIIAVRSGGADTVTDRVQRVAQIQTADLGPDQRAEDMKLSAVLRWDEHAIEVIPVSGEFDRRAPLQLRLLHPARADADQQLQLPPGGQGWRLDLPQDTPFDASHDWNVQLGPADGAWRLKGRLPKAQQAAHLGPSLKDAGAP